MKNKHPGYLKKLWWTIKWAFIRNKPVVKPEVREVHYAFPPMDLRMKREEDLSDGALE